MFQTACQYSTSTGNRKWGQILIHNPTGVSVTPVWAAAAVTVLFTWKGRIIHLNSHCAGRWACSSSLCELNNGTVPLCQVLHLGSQVHLLFVTGANNKQVSWHHLCNAKTAHKSSTLGETCSVCTRKMFWGSLGKQTSRDTFRPVIRTTPPVSYYIAAMRLSRGCQVLGQNSLKPQTAHLRPRYVDKSLAQIAAALFAGTCLWIPPKYCPQKGIWGALASEESKNVILCGCLSCRLGKICYPRVSLWEVFLQWGRVSDHRRREPWQKGPKYATKIRSLIKIWAAVGLLVSARNCTILFANGLSGPILSVLAGVGRNNSLPSFFLVFFLLSWTASLHRSLWNIYSVFITIFCVLPLDVFLSACYCCGHEWCKAHGTKWTRWVPPEAAAGLEEKAGPNENHDPFYWQRHRNNNDHQS